MLPLTAALACGTAQRRTDEPPPRDENEPPKADAKAPEPKPPKSYVSLPEPKPPEPKPPEPEVEPPEPASKDLADEVVEAFASIRADPPPRALTNAKHYVISNERNLHNWSESVRDLGGVFVGVGTDQMYVLAGWCRPEVVVLMDFDQLVVDLHDVYAAFFVEAENPEQFVELWAPTAESRRRARELIRAGYPEERRKRRAIRAWSYSHRIVHKRLTRTRERFRRRSTRSFLDDPEQYAFVRGLWQQKRVFAVRGDLLGTITVKQIADVARRFELPVRVLYLSNTEMYFGYKRTFKRNMLAMPFDDRSLVLRTLPIKPADYRYIVQPGKNFQAWVQHPKVWNVWGMYKKRQRQGADGQLFLIDAEPPPTPGN